MIDPDGGSTGNCCPDPPITQTNSIVLDQVNVYTKPKVETKREILFVPKSGPKVTSGWQAAWNRTTGFGQMLGGMVEMIGGGIGGAVTAETGVGAVLGYAIAANGLDNTITGGKQLWTGETQDTYLHTGVKNVAIFAGSDEETAEDIATGADYATLVLGGGSALKTVNSPATGGVKQWFRLDKSFSSVHGKTSLSIKWGAGKAHVKKIKSLKLRELNKKFRAKKLPGKSWRVKDPGHFHLKR